MKIIHTADWHLGHRLYNFDRTDEEIAFLERLAEIVDQERPDALVISGDVFHTCAPGNDVAKRFCDGLLEVQSRSPKTEIVLIAGNHDSYSRLEVDKSLWKRLHVTVIGTPAETADGCADFSGNIVEIPDKGLVAAVPFCHARNFPTVPGDASERRDLAYFKGLATYVADANKANLPAVLMAHLPVGRDTDLAGHENLAVIGGEETVDIAELGSGYDYIALGHIHMSQWIKGERKLARYAGTPRPIHFDERHRHGVDVVEVVRGQEPQVKTVELLEKYRLVTVGGEKGLPFEEAMKELGKTELQEGDFVRVNVSMGADEPEGPNWRETARAQTESKHGRFALLNPIREKVANSESPVKSMTMQEIRKLTDEDVIGLIAAEHALSAEQKDLLRGLLSEMNNAARE